MSSSVTLRRLFRMQYGQALPSDLRREGDTPVVSSGGQSGTHDRPNTGAPVIVVGRKGSYGSVHWSPEPAFVIDTAYFVDATCTSNDLRWLYYVLIAADLGHLSEDVGVPGLSREYVYDTRLGIAPDVEEQRRIAGFLDDQTACLDAARQVREAQIDLLAAHHVADIYATLTGRDIEQRIKIRSATWLADVPDGWSLEPVSARYDVQLGKMLNEERAAADGQAPYLRNANVTWCSISTDDLATMSFSPADRLRYLVRAGDLMVCEGGAGVAEAAVYDASMTGVYYQKSLHRVRSRNGYPVEWLMYWLRLAKFSGIFASEGQLTTIPHLPAERLRRYRIPIAPDAVRRVIGLRERWAITEQLITRLRAAMDLIVERKRTLIKAAVTGEFDVTTASSRAIADVLN